MRKRKQTNSLTVGGEFLYMNDVPEVYLGDLPVSKLTDKQKELLQYLINGYTNKKRRP